MCGCSITTTGGGAAAGMPPISGVGPTPGVLPPSPVAPYAVSSGQLPTQTDVNDSSVRNVALAERSLERLRYATRNLATPAQAAAAGYRPNPSAPDHWINDSVFAQRNGYDLEHPATIMFEGNQLVGVMLSHDPRKGPPPDLGAGTWHTHGGTAGAEYAAHVLFNKPMQSAFGSETGDV